jgi:ABC-type multidrug transport system fused ATPase/permease subunit
MGGRAFANFELVLSALIFVGYFLFAPNRTAFADTFLPLAWLPFLVMMVAQRSVDRSQWTALRAARMILLERYARIDPALAQAIQLVLIPHRIAGAMAIYQIMFVVSFAVLLFYQGWATALLAFFTALVVGVVVSSVSAALPSAGAAGDRRRLRAIHSCLERRLLVQPGDATIPDITRFELHREIGSFLENPAPFNFQYLSALRAAQTPDASGAA